MPFSSTAVDKLEALRALDSPHDGVEQQETIKPLIEKTKASLAESRFQRAPSPLEATEPRECWNQVGEKKSRSDLDTDINENIYTTGIDKDDAEARNREDVAAEIIALQDEPVSDPTPSEPETQTSGEWGSQSTQAMSWEVRSLPLNQETSSVASGNSRMQLVEDQPNVVSVVSLRKAVRTVPFVKETVTGKGWDSERSEGSASKAKNQAKEEPLQGKLEYEGRGCYHGLDKKNWILKQLL